MSEPFHEGQRGLQDRFDTRRLADRISLHPQFTPTIDEAERGFIERADMFFLATTSADGQPECSYRGGDPGFVRVLDERTVAFPNYDGNGLYVSCGNIVVSPKVGLLFIDFEQGHRMRLNGEASIDLDDPLAAEYPGAQFVVRVRTTLVYPNCKRYVHRLALVERSRFVPHGAAPPPVPSWKREEWVCDALPLADPARDAGRDELPAAPDY